jgi:hypothetical protein
MRILGNGNVGIGTTSPWAQLSINPNGLTGPAFAVGSSTGTSFVISNGGWVGIGTSTPHATLDIESKPIEPDLVSKRRSGGHNLVQKLGFHSWAP